jgi:hypothetical protein
MRDIANWLVRQLPKDYGFVLFVFPFGKPGAIGNYITNTTKESMIAVMEEKLRKLKGGDDFETPEEN